VGDVELEAPELDVDEEAGRFRRGVAVLVVIITLFGAIVSYAQAVESNDEDIAARDAQRRAVEGLGAQVDASAALVSDLRVASSIDAVLQRQAINAGRVSAFAEGSDLDADVHLAARDRLAQVAEAVADLTPVDPSDTATLDADFAERNRRPDQARLRQGIEADLANQHGGKADTYVAILTVLAVALFLLGLSLTVEGSRRFVLLVPGVAIAVVCVGWSLLTWSRHVERVSDPAIVDVAEGQALQDAGDFEGAIAHYDEAIEDSPDFAAAYARRASARFLQGSSQLGQTGFISLTTEEALEDALADLDEALARGGDTDVNTVADAGFFRFLAGDFDESVELTSDALDQNQLIASLWFNLGAAHVARDDRNEAEDAYEEGFDVLFENEPSASTRSQVLAGARTDLSILRTLLDGDELDDVIGLIEDTEARLADAELESTTCPDGEPCDIDIDAGGAEVAAVDFTRTGAFVNATVEVDGLDDGDAVGVAWYFRTDGEEPFAQASLSFDAVEVSGGSVFTSTIPLFTPACPVVGDYLLRAYAGGELIGEAAASIGDEISPIDPDEEGPSAVEPEFGVGTPLGSRFEALVDPVEGIETCVPEGFEVEELDLSEADAFTTYSSEEEGLSIGINVLPGALEDFDFDLDQAEQELIDQFIVDGETFPFSAAGRTIDGDPISLDGLAAVGEDIDGDQSGLFVVLGPDNSNRTILVTTFAGFDGDLRAVLTEVIDTVTFTGVDTAAP
jgi:tetratricopeptide (TPR) repeat protein